MCVRVLVCLWRNLVSNALFALCHAGMLVVVLTGQLLACLQVHVMLGMRPSPELVCILCCSFA